MINSEDFIFVQRQSSPKSKNISSNTDDHLVNTFSARSAHPCYLGTYIQIFLSKMKIKSCIKRQIITVNSARFTLFFFIILKSISIATKKCSCTSSEIFQNQYGSLLNAHFLSYKNLTLFLESSLFKFDLIIL